MDQKGTESFDQDGAVRCIGIKIRAGSSPALWPRMCSYTRAKYSGTFHPLWE